MSDTPKRKPGSLLKRALFNQYNYILLGSTALFSATTGSWLPAVIGGGPRSCGWCWAPTRRRSATGSPGRSRRRPSSSCARRSRRCCAALDEHYTDRFEALMQLNAEVQALARENKGLETALIADEMAKLEQLLHSFLKMASGHQRLAHYMRENSVADVEAEIADTSRRIKRETDHRVQASLKQSLALAQKRLQKQQQIEGACKALAVQMGTVEKSFDYLKSHILGISTHQELSAALDDLVSGVASVSELDTLSTDDLTDAPRAAPPRRARRRRRKGEDLMLATIAQITLPAIVVFTTLFGVMARGNPKPGGVALFLRVGLAGLALSLGLFYLVTKTGGVQPGRRPRADERLPRHRHGRRHPGRDGRHRRDAEARTVGPGWARANGGHGPRRSKHRPRILLAAALGRRLLGDVAEEHAGALQA